MNIHPVGAVLFHEDGRTDGLDEAIAAFRSFTNAPKSAVCCNNYMGAISTQRVQLER